MKPPIFPVIRQRLIACVDDGAIELYPLIDVVDDVIGTLTELKINLRLWLWRGEIKFERRLLTNTTSAPEKNCFVHEKKGPRQGRSGSNVVPPSPTHIIHT